MPSPPMCQPDGPAIRELIRKRGYSVAGFRRMISRSPATLAVGRPPSTRSIWRAISGEPARTESIHVIACGLRVKPSDISDWTGDDDLYESDAETKVPA